MSADRCERLQAVLAVLRMRLARQRGDLPAVAEETQRLLEPAAAAGSAWPGLGGDLRTLALINLGIAAVWTARFDEADRHLEQGVALAHRIGRPYLEITALAHWAQLVSWRSFLLGAQRSKQAIELAGRHGWTEEPVAGVAQVALGMAMIAQGRLEEGARSLEQAERTLRAEVEPAAGMRLHHARGLIELVSGRYDAALAAFRTAERLAGLLATQHALILRLRSHLLQTLMRMGKTQSVDQAFAEMDGPERDSAKMRNAIAVLRLAQDDPQAATVALAPVIDGSVSLMNAHLREVQVGCLRRSPATCSATRAPPGAPLSTPSISPSQKACSSRSCSTPRPACSSATAGKVPLTPT